MCCGSEIVLQAQTANFEWMSGTNTLVINLLELPSLEQDEDAHCFVGVRCAHTGFHKLASFGSTRCISSSSYLFFQQLNVGLLVIASEVDLRHLGWFSNYSDDSSLVSLKSYKLIGSP